MDNETLTHHGIKGMRWGVRRTPEQLGRRTTNRQKKSLSDIGSSVLKRVKKGKFTKADGKIKGTGQKAEREAKLAKKQEVLKARSAKALYENADLFSDIELKAAYNRLSTEQNVKDLSKKEVTRGMEYVDKAITWGNKASDLMEAGTKAWNSYAKISNALAGTNLPTIGGKNDKKKTYNYAELRKKTLGDLSDDELKAFNERSKAEDTYYNYDAKAKRRAEKEAAENAKKAEKASNEQSSNSEKKSDSSSTKTYSGEVVDSVKDTPANSQTVSDSAERGRSYIEGMQWGVQGTLPYYPKDKKDK